jgi:hypothetical protein
MEQKLTHDDTLVLQEVVRLDGDLLLLPEQAPIPVEEARALMTAGNIDPKESTIFRGVVDVCRLTEEYNSERRGDDLEPEWVHEMPMAVRTWMRVQYALTQEDTFANVPGFAYTGLSYTVVYGGLCEEVYRQFNLNRLERIKQLGFLNQPSYNNYYHYRQSLSDGTRFLHSLDTMAIGTVIGHNLELSESKMHRLRTLLLSHDAAMPAGGDSVKLVDPVGLDEDTNYRHVVAKADFRRLKAEFGVTPESLLGGIHNHGLLGEVLDIADKLAYIARDIHKCLHHLEAGANNDQLGLRTLLLLLKRFPYVCSVWDCVEEQAGHAVFTSVPRLAAFLKVRVLMFRELYYHPEARFGEYLMSRLFVKDLFRRGLITVERLLEIDDSELIRLLDMRYGSGAILDTCSSDKSRCNAFRTPEEAREFVETLKKGGHSFWLVDDNRRAIKTGTNLLVRGRTGPITLGEADRGLARELDEMATMYPLVHVYWLDGDPALSRKVLADLKESLHAT